MYGLALPAHTENPPGYRLARAGRVGYPRGMKTTTPIRILQLGIAAALAASASAHAQTARTDRSSAARTSAGGGLARAVITKIEFRAAAIDEIIETLAEVSRTLDPSGKGINFIYVPDRNPQSAAARARVDRKVSVGLENATLQDTIGTLCQILDLEWGTAHGAVWIGPRGALPQQVNLQTRQYYASPEVVSAVLGSSTNRPLENRPRLQR